MHGRSGRSGRLAVRLLDLRGLGRTGPMPIFTVPAAVRAILLDIDGTLVDHRGAADVASYQWASTLPGWSLGPGETAELWETLDRRYFTRYQMGELAFGDQLRARIRDFVPDGATLSDAQADAHMRAYREVYRSLWRAYDDVPGFLTRLRRAGADRPGGPLTVAYLSNGDQAPQREKLAAVGALETDWPLLASVQLGASKPSAGIFEEACRRLSVAPSHALMIGDDPWADVDGDLGAGLCVVYLRRDGGSPEHDVPTVDGLDAILIE